MALDGVSFSITAGSVHALLGENGAGKSTLVKILSGLVTPDQGEIHVNGKAVRFHSPKDAHAAGIVTAAQELALVPHLSLAANLFLGREPRNRIGLVTNEGLARKARRVFEEFGLAHLDPDAPVGSLPLAARQQLELVRLLDRRGRVLLLDEPTAALGASEVDWLFNRVRAAQRDGATVVLVSHRMSEIRELCDSFTVLRNGRHVASTRASEVTDSDVVKLMIGHEVERRERASAERVSDVPVLEVEGLAAPPALRNATLKVHAGEIVGVAALQGHGQYEMFMTLFGVLRRAAGKVVLNAEPVHGMSPHKAVHRYGIAMVPEDRKTEGVMLRMSGLANLALPVLDRCSRLGWVNAKTERALALNTMKRLAVKREALHQDVSALSGGNQQKIAIGKWLERGSKLFLMYDPTRGVDIGTKEEIYGLLRSIATQGSGVLVYSTDIEELLTVSDRILVFYRGEVVAEFDGATCSRTEVLRAMLGSGEPRQTNGKPAQHEAVAR